MNPVAGTAAPPAATAAASLLAKVSAVLNARFPLALADSSWDNVGVLLENPRPSGSNCVMLTIDLTPAVLQECVEQRVEVIVAYHPPIFAPLKRLTLGDSKQNTILQCVAEGMSIYSPHTSFDAAAGGINDWLMDALGVAEECRAPITPSTILPDGSRPRPGDTVRTGFGRVGTLAAPTKLSSLAPALKRALGVPTLRVAMPGGSATSARGIAAGDEFLVRTVAVCAGSGASVFRKLKEPVDLVVTGELSHHEVLALNDQGTTVVLTEHTNSERGFLDAVLRPLLTADLADTGATVVVSHSDADPLFVW